MTSRSPYERVFARPSLGLLLSAVLCVAPACRNKAHADTETGGSAGAQAEASALDLHDDTPNLLVTWIDEKGDFHVTDKLKDVPSEARENVRVVDTTREGGAIDEVFVANMREVTPTGAYRVRSMSRSEWEELGATRRKARLEALAPSKVPSASPDASGNPAANPNLVVFIYGADWCKPCHDAERFLKQKGVNVVKKDIEKTPAFAEEMQKKLAKVGRAGSSIPVIDVAGQILIGFDPRAIDAALRQSGRNKAL